MNKAHRNQPVQRLVAGYLPSNIIPAVVSVGMVVVFTRLLSPAAYGLYSLAFMALTVVQVSVFYPVGLSILRFYPAAQRQDNERNFLRTAFCGLLFVASVVVVIAAVVIAFVPLPPRLVPLLWLAIPLLVLRAGIAANQAVKRARGDILPYTIVASGQSLIGFAAGLIFVVSRGPRAENVMLGLLVGSGLMFAYDITRFLRNVTQGRFDASLRNEVLRLAAPLSVTYAVNAALQYGDRFLIGGLAGIKALGIYTVAFALVERPTALIGVAVATATFPLVVHTLERDGLDAARRQAGSNGIMLLMMVAPACVGLMLIARPLAAVMVGPAFRPGLAMLLPIIALAALLRIVSAHFVDQAYYLARRSDLMLLAYGPFAALNIAIDLFVIPRYGIIGAAWTALACLVAQIITSTMIARRIFPVWLPAGEAARIVGALIPMAIVASLIHAENQWLQLVFVIGASGLVYAGMVLMLDIGGMRLLFKPSFGRAVVDRKTI